MRASSASWAAEVAWRECIKLCSGDASRARWVAGRLFVGVVGSLSCPLVYDIMVYWCIAVWFAEIE
jgi:hypothetical protein